jgi:uncharacterized membrane protein
MANFFAWHVLLLVAFLGAPLLLVAGAIFVVVGFIRRKAIDVRPPTNHW